MIGVVVEGIGEIETVRAYISKIDQSLKVFGRPLYADLQPKANPKVIVAAARNVINQLRRRGATKVVVIIDLEDRPCPVQFANELKEAFCSAHPDLLIAPVVKHHCLENWMIGDPGALRKMQKRFNKFESIENAIKRGGADMVKDPLKLLDGCAIKTSFHKTMDPPRIAAHQDIDKLSISSRSFKKFLCEIGHSPCLSKKR